MIRWASPEVSSRFQFERKQSKVSTSETPKYPLLEEILSIKNLPLQPMYTIRDIAKMFSVSVRAIQNRIVSKKLPWRDLPGRAKFLSQDLETYLRTSRKEGR